jgi:excisionase family DNA binding protein
MPRATIETSIPSVQEAHIAREAARVLEGEVRDIEVLRLQLLSAKSQSKTIELPALAAKLLYQLLEELAAGNVVAIVSADAEITTQQAADLLLVSRPYVVGLIERGVLPARLVGNQRRLALKSVLAYKADTQAKAIEGLQEIAAIDQQLGLR